MSTRTTAAAPAALPLDAAERAAWERALALWSVHMHDPQLLPGAGEKHGSIAWFTFPPAVAVDPERVAAGGLTGDLESLFSHEIGHHVLAPSTRIDALKIRHQLARALAAAGAPAVRAEDVGLLANLWSDLLVNTRVVLLQKRRDKADSAVASTEPPLIGLVRRSFRPSYDSSDRLWWVYRRAYELLWNLIPGTLCPATAPPPDVIPVPKTSAQPEGVSGRPLPKIEDLPERFREQERVLREARREADHAAAELDRVITTQPALDAESVADLVRAFAGDAVSGALTFGVIVAPYIVEAQHAARARGAALESARIGPAGEGGCAVDDTPATTDELGRVLGDGRLHGEIPARNGAGPADGASVGGGAGAGVGKRSDSRSAGQGFGVAETLALYDTADADAVLAAWYRAEAAPWVRPFTERRPDKPSTDLPGPLEVWDLGEDLADIDWSATLQAGAQIVPGVTTRQRSQLDDDPIPVETSVDLDLYIDSSGSMPHPRAGSAAVLAGTILALSVLRGGGRVRVTSWSGPGQVAGAESFTRDHVRVVANLSYFFGGGTSFPLDRYADRYEKLSPPQGGVTRHVVVLSDDGLRSMFGVGNEPFEHVAADVRKKLTTATLVLLDRRAEVAPLATEAGYQVIYLRSMDDAPQACAQLAKVLHEGASR